MNLDEFINSGHYLPKFMRDFHDQKRLFQRIDLFTETADRNFYLPGWMSAHVYVIDFFLWYMARHGYTLQRSRANVEFFDIHADLKSFTKRRVEVKRQTIEESLKRFRDGLKQAAQRLEQLNEAQEVTQ